MRPRNIHELPTPALLVDAAVMRRNITAAADFVRDRTVRLRPHFKNHKCVPLALEQLRAGGAVGITAATVAETEALVRGGVHDVLLANLVVDPLSIKRLVALANDATVRVATESLANIDALSRATVDAGVELGVLVELDIGLGRCGISPEGPVVELARAVTDAPGLRFDGLQAYHGSASHIEDAAERAAYAVQTMSRALDARARIERAGLECSIVSGGGTSTYRAIADLPGVTELQLGSYLTMDWVHHEALAGEFEVALSVLTTVVSVRPDVVVLNVGAKGVAHEFGAPRVLGHPEALVRRYTVEEHTMVEWPDHSCAVGDHVRLLPSHCCGTCNLYRDLVLHEGDMVAAIHPISGTGYALGPYQPFLPPHSELPR